MMIEGEPAANIQPRVTGGVIDGRNVAKEEVGIRTLSNRGNSKKSAPSLSGVSKQQHACLLGTPQERGAGTVNARIATSLGIARRRLLNLS